MKEHLPPVLLPHTSEKGFHAIAAEDIPACTLLCEYLGNVEHLGSEPIDNDSVMELLNLPKTPSKSLVIVPRYHANLGRFFNCSTGSVVPNLNTIRCWLWSVPASAKLTSAKSELPSKEVRIFIYTARTIKKGEEMVFDYNAGKKQRGEAASYNTTGFVG